MGYVIPVLILSDVTYGGYISLIKFLVFGVLFFLWLPLVTWIHNDAKQVETDDVLWTGLVLGTGAVATLIWLLVPIFLIGLFGFLLAAGATSLAYVKHRNARVMDFDRVLTAEHIKGLFAGKEKKLEALKGFVFVTANNNEVPVPQPKTPDFFGYKATHDLLNDASWRRAETIIFAPSPQGYKPTYYVDGAAITQPHIPREQMEYLLRFIKQLADLNVKERRKPQRGTFRIQRKDDYTDWEVITAGSTVGEQLKIKQAIHKSALRLSEVGLMPEQLKNLKNIATLKQGLFIVSGTPKSGVTTTLYAMLRSHDAFLNSINTLELKPSGELPNITQNVFSPSDSGTTTYAEKLKAVIRMGPDIVGVTDCNDTQTAQVACAGAKDGKIIYVLLNSESVVQTLGKWLKLVGDRNLAIDALLGISNQRLLRVLCKECRQAYGPNQELLRKFNIPAEKAKVLYRAGKVQYDRRGKPSTCEHCQGTGYVGRTGVFEIVMFTKELKNAVKRAKSLSDIATQFRKAKMLYLQEQALRKVIGGTTAINEMIRVLSATKKQRKKG
jgi:general secretion pathway protein E